MVLHYRLHLVLTHGHADLKHTLGIGLQHLILATHGRCSINIEAYALYGDATALVHHLTSHLERRLVGEVHRVALCLCIEQAQLLLRLELVYTQSGDNHVAGTVTSIGQRTYAVRTIGTGISLVAQLTQGRYVGAAQCCAAHHAMVLVVVDAIIGDIEEAALDCIVEGVVGLQTCLVTYEVAAIVALDVGGRACHIPDAHLIDGALIAIGGHHHLIGITCHGSRALRASLLHSIEVYIEVVFIGHGSYMHIGMFLGIDRQRRGAGHLLAAHLEGNLTTLVEEFIHASLLDDSTRSLRTYPCLQCSCCSSLLQQATVVYLELVVAVGHVGLAGDTLTLGNLGTHLHIGYGLTVLEGHAAVDVARRRTETDNLALIGNLVVATATVLDSYNLVLVDDARHRLGVAILVAGRCHIGIYLLYLLPIAVAAILTGTDRELVYRTTLNLPLQRYAVAVVALRCNGRSHIAYRCRVEVTVAHHLHFSLGSIYRVARLHIDAIAIHIAGSGQGLRIGGDIQIVGNGIGGGDSRGGIGTLDHHVGVVAPDVAVVIGPCELHLTILRIFASGGSNLLVLHRKVNAGALHIAPVPCRGIGTAQAVVVGTIEVLLRHIIGKGIALGTLKGQCSYGLYGGKLLILTALHLKVAACHHAATIRGDAPSDLHVTVGLLCNLEVGRMLIGGDGDIGCLHIDKLPV